MFSAGAPGDTPPPNERVTPTRMLSTLASCSNRAVSPTSSTVICNAAIK